MTEYDEETGEELDHEEILIEETGEILAVPRGDQRAAWLAHQFDLSRTQKREWEARAAMLQSLLLKAQDERRAVYDDVVITRYEGRTTHPFDREGFLEHIEYTEATIDDYRALLRMVSGLDYADRHINSDDDRATRWAERVSITFVGEKRGQDYLKATPVRRLAPRGRTQ